MEKESIKDRNFGVLISIFFIILGVRFLLNGNALGYWTFLVAVIFLCTSIFVPNLLHPMNHIWTEIGLKMGHLMTPVVMLIAYIIAVLPTAFIMRILHKDPLQRMLNRNASSYWLVRTDANSPMGSMKNQF
jgi:hypothetical protein